MAGPGRIKTRNRTKARVQISYMNPNEGNKLVEIPFVMGVMAGLSGNNPGEVPAPVARREFVPVDIDNFDKFMGSVQPGVRVNVKNELDPAKEGEEEKKIGFNVRFNSMADFEPAAVVSQIPQMARLLEARQKLETLRTYFRGNAEEELQKLLKDTRMMRMFSEGASDSKVASDDNDAEA